MKRNGFTVIELLLIVSIVGIVVVIAVPALPGQRNKNSNYRQQGEEITFVSDVIRVYGPPDRTDVVGAYSFLYYKQSDGSFTIYTIEGNHIKRVDTRR